MSTKKKPAAVASATAPKTAKKTRSFSIAMLPLTQCLGMAHERNPKEHGIPALIASIKRFGFTSPPLIDEETGVMVAGHGRCEALEQMLASGEIPPDGVEEKNKEWYLPVIRGVRFASDLERDAYVIADNQNVIAGGWDYERLSSILEDVGHSELGFEGLGFEQIELDNLLGNYDPTSALGAAGGDGEGGGGREVPVSEHTRVIGGHKVRPPVQMTSADWSVHLGDCLEWLKTLADNSVDAIVTDPPAGIKFMGREWDSDKGGRDAWIAWLQSIMVECLRVLKPGGHLLGWALPRTSHWTAFAVENAGFEIRDRLSHIFGSGFPKSLDVSKAIDAKLGVERQVVGKQQVPGDQLKEMSRGGSGGENMANGHGWSGIKYGGAVSPEAKDAEGWGTALKPAMEDWWLARKPLDGTVAENVLKHGTGGINIDGCRIGDELMPVTRSDGHQLSENLSMAAPNTGRIKLDPKSGRWPAHLLLSHAPGCVAIGTAPDERSVNVGGRVGNGSRSLEFGMGKMDTETVESTTTITRCVLGCPIRTMDEQSDAEQIGAGASRFFYVAKPSRSETEAGLEELPSATGGEATGRSDDSAGLKNPRAGAGRNGGRKNTHPTKKSIELMRWLIRLITPAGGLVVDPFTGSGTTGLAALVEGCRFAGCELLEKHHLIATTRLRTIIEDPRAIETIDVDDE